MKPNTVPEPGICHMMLARKKQGSPSDAVETCHIWMDFQDEGQIHKLLDSLRPFLQPGTGISVNPANSLKPIINEGFPLAMRAPSADETGSVLPVSEDLKSEIGDCRMAYRNAHGIVIEPSRLIVEALIRYRQDLQHKMDDRRGLARAKMGRVIES